MTVGSVKQDSKARGAPDAIFSDAFTAARTGFSDMTWESLAPQEKTRAIYQEMRRLDRNRIAETLRSATAAGSRAAGTLLETAGG